MPSLDFVYDLVEKFDDENLDYLVLSMRKGKVEDKVDVFFNINPEAEDTFHASLDQIKDILKKRKGKNGINKKPKVKKPAKKKRRKEE
jgi:hypothetical protein|tara:strand:- start:1219 stop:1482 length:264 start_codon:yes stop_codon:yes gene_type:complete